MGIYLPNMEMPTEYPLWIVVSADGTVQYNYFNEWKTAKEKAVSIPPHGRLIVEDDAIETAWMILAGLGYRREENPQLEQAVREVYATAPTIEVE